ncbi:MAG: HTTM domain-containing protein [Bryobacteraceae bacterium]
MSVRSVVKAWDEFFFTPQSPVAIALFRVLYGMLLIADLVLLRPDWLAWYGEHSWTSLATILKLEPGLRLNLFTILPHDDSWVEAFFWTFLVSAVSLMFGFLTRINSVIAFLCLTSIQQRNLYITNSGDTFLRVAGFFLMFAPAGAALSIDRLVRIRRGKEGPEIQPRAPWAQRMIQFELSLLYIVAFWWKSTGAAWVNGTAVFYLNHLADYQRFPLPSWIENSIFVKLGSWLTLVIEFSLGVLVWFKELRYPVLLAGLLFHLFLEYRLEIPLFQWTVLSAYVLFIDPHDLARSWDWIRKHTPRFHNR